MQTETRVIQTMSVPVLAALVMMVMIQRKKIHLSVKPKWVHVMPDSPVVATPLIVKFCASKRNNCVSLRK